MPPALLLPQHCEAHQEENLSNKPRHIEPVGKIRFLLEAIAVDPLLQRAGKAAVQGLAEGAAEAAFHVAAGGAVGGFGEEGGGAEEGVVWHVCAVEGVWYCAGEGCGVPTIVGLGSVSLLEGTMR